PIPDIRAGVRRRQNARVMARRSVLRLAAALLIGLAVLLAVPQVRAAVLEFIRVGAVRLFSVPPPTVVPTATFNLPGLTTLADAQTAAGFTLPPEFGLPDQSYLPFGDGALVTLVWLGADGQPRMIMEILQNELVGSKYDVQSGQAVTVNGVPGYWLKNPHEVAYFSDGRELLREVTHAVLLWADIERTYRLESDLTLEAARALAEALG
ncbi:MAG: hypothetical protein JNJ61_09265, partial [Anaerolineae bacterium]|nr:hypothetical protein [Anaerolineae bacterium]